MCRWLAYSGSPILLEELLYKPKPSLIDQSLHARLGVETTNGDGVGVGWYAEDPANEIPAVFRDVGPAWSNRNLRELASQVRSPLLFGHIRASTGTAVQQTNCHPFRYGHWLWMHNGSIGEFLRFKRDLVLQIAPSLYPHIEGSTDSEAMFYLALSLGLEKDPPAAVQQMVEVVERVGRQHDVDHPIQMTVATSDGQRIWAFRYSSEHNSRSLFFSTDVLALREMYPDNPSLQLASAESRLVVSEPIGDLEGAWNEVPESSWGVIQEGDDEIHPFVPQAA
jgi:predicted glutamine amidotransferase